jgi:hypothetical protein
VRRLRCNFIVKEDVMSAHLISGVVSPSPLFLPSPVYSWCRPADLSTQMSSCYRE